MGYDFVNPYNFFPLGEKKAVYKENGETVSGEIEYSILTKTPLMIPDTTKPFVEKVLVDEKVEKDHSHYAFMSLNDLSKFAGKISELNDDITKPNAPFIPGSQMRGMVRSVYEMLTDSCLSTLNDDDILSKRTHEAFSAGLLQKNGNGTYSLYKADDCIFRAEKNGSVRNAGNSTYRKVGDVWKYVDEATKSYKINNSDYHEGQKIFFKRTVRENGRFKSTAKNLSLTKTLDSPDIGYLLKGIDGPKMKDKLKEKHNCHVFYKKPELVANAVNLSILETVIKAYEVNGFPYKEYEEHLNNFKKSGEVGTYFPVYYSKCLEEIFLSPAVFTREIYQRRIKTLVKSFNPCSEKENLCPTCSLFGTINIKNNAIASRIRFSDLNFVSSQKNGDLPNYKGKTTLIPLSSPKISNMEFYLERPSEDAIFWTYDYYVTVKGEVKKNLSGISGRKFYWHHTNLLTTTEKSDQNRTVYPLSEGNIFSGKLYFDNIDKSELNRLIYILNCGENEDISLENRTHCYKLGSAKSAGFGSIASKVTAVKLRSYSCAENDYSVNKYQPQPPELENIENFKKMTDFSENYKVDYPKLEENGDIFGWFSQNHKGVNRKNGKIVPAGKGNIILDMPNSRQGEMFMEYLKPMQPKLSSLKSLVENSSSAEKSYTSNYNKYGKKQNFSIPNNTVNKLTCSVCGKEESVTYDWYKQWNGTGKYKCKGCRTAAKKG